MKKSLLKYAAIPALAAGLVFAQVPATNPPSGAANTHQGRRAFRRNHRARIAQELNLTDAQKQQARTIFQQACQSAQPVRQQLKQNRQALTAAAKAGNSDADIQKLSTEQGSLLGQLVAIRTESASQFYQMLTPEQRAKADQMHQQFRQRSHSGERKNG